MRTRGSGEDEAVRLHCRHVDAVAEALEPREVRRWAAVDQHFVQRRELHRLRHCPASAHNLTSRHFMLHEASIFGSRQI